MVNEKESETLELFNFGDGKITNIELSSDIIFMELEKIENLSGKAVKNLTINFLPKNPGHFTGNIFISYSQSDKNSSVQIPLNLFILPEGSNISNFKISEKTCIEINGTVCQKEEICEGNSTFTKGGEYCCLDKCKKLNEESSSATNWIIGILALLVIITVSYFIYKKSKSARPKKPEDKIREISENYSKRISGGISRN